MAEIRSGQYETPEQRRERAYRERVDRMLPHHDESLLDADARRMMVVRRRLKQRRYRESRDQ